MAWATHENDINSIGPISAAISTACVVNEGTTFGSPISLQASVRKPISVRASAGATNSASDEYLSSDADPLDLLSKPGQPNRLSDCAKRTRKTTSDVTAANAMADDQL